jgi:hypothetical protein
VAARTLSSPPGSPPLNIALANITAGTALASWRPPAKPNGVVYKYVLELAYEDSQGRTQAAQRFQVFNTTEASIGNLLSYTRYRYYRTYYLFPYRKYLFKCLLKFGVKILFCKKSFSPLNIFMRKGKDPEPDPDPYL